MRRMLIVVAACSHAPAATPTPPAAPPAAAGPAAEAGSAAPPSGDFRAYTAPAPLLSPGPAAQPGSGCRASEPQLVAHETAREHAALDAELRAHGSMLVQARMLETTERHPRGSIFRGRDGERWLVVSETHTCTPFIPLVAIDAQLDVFTVNAVAKPATKRTITLCQPICGGCGTPTPLAPVVVEVPAGAHLVAGRNVEYPIDIEVSFTASHECEPVP
ncbi:MAG: hypothetical protein ACM31C_09500 [Acidobacteriota bacterium]